MTAARIALQELADRAADARGGQRRVVPRLHPLAIAEQFAVLLDDAARAAVPVAEFDEVLSALESS